jgi:nitrite reductase/ring-hydroxylating ferredoxin subunit
MGFRSFIKRKVREQLSPSPARPSGGEKVELPWPAGADAEGFVAVLREHDLADGSGRTVAVDSTAIAVFHAGGSYYAIDDACTHEDAPLGEGEVRGTTVVCPYHDWVFDLTTGDCISFPDRPVGCFDTKVDGGFVWVGKRTREGTHDRGGAHADGLKTSEHAS